MESSGQRLLLSSLTSVCIMDLSEVINRPCSYSCFLVSLFLALRWIIAHCATCRWVALLWLPYGHQAFAYLLPMNHGAQKTHSNIFRSSSLLHLLPCFTLSLSFGLSFSLLFLQLSFSHCFSSFIFFLNKLLSLSFFPCALILLYAFPAA